MFQTRIASCIEQNKSSIEGFWGRGPFLQKGSAFASLASLAPLASPHAFLFIAEKSA